MTWFHDHVCAEFEPVAKAIDRMLCSRGESPHKLPDGSAALLRNVIRQDKDYSLKEPAACTYSGLPVVFDASVPVDDAYVLSGALGPERVLIGGAAP